MQLTTTFLAPAMLTTLLLLLLVPTSTAKCYKKGPNFVNKQIAMDAVGVMCSNFQGWFDVALQRTGCATDLANGESWFFAVTNIAYSSHTLDYDTCTAGVKLEINGCSVGGDSKQSTGWEFRVDANVGTCADGAYINNHPHDLGGTPPKRDSEAITRSNIVYAFGMPAPPHEDQERRDISADEEAEAPVVKSSVRRFRAK